MCRVLLLALFASMFACDGGGSDEFGEGGAGPSSCVPGASAACTCTDGSSGAQSCSVDGVFEACSCTDGAGGAGGVPRCVPGASAACACSSGSMGAQTCGADGTYSPCDCGGGSGGAGQAGIGGGEAGGAGGAATGGSGGAATGGSGGVSAGGSGGVSAGGAGGAAAGGSGGSAAGGAGGASAGGSGGAGLGGAGGSSAGGAGGFAAGGTGGFATGGVGGLGTGGAAGIGAGGAGGAGGGFVLGPCGPVPTNSGGGDAIWSRSFGERRDAQLASAVAVAADCSIALGGTFATSIDFGLGALSTAGPSSGYVAVFDIDGTPRWSRAIAGVYVDQVAFGPSGEVMVAGYAYPNTDFGAGPLPGTGREQGFVASYDALGGLRWAHVLGDDDGYVSGLDVDPQGSTLLTAAFVGSFDFGGHSVSGPGQGVAIVKLDPTGTVIWMRAITAPAGNFVENPRIGVDASGSSTIAVGADRELTLPDGANHIISAGVWPGNLVLVRLDASGQLFATTDVIGGGIWRSAVALDVSPAGATTLVGMFTGHVNFGFGDLFTVGGLDIFVVVLEPNLSQRSARSFGTASEDYAMEAAFDPLEGVAFGVGSAGPSLDLGNGPLTFVDSSDIYLARRSSTDAPLWSVSRATPQVQFIQGLAFAPDGTLVVAGSYEAHLDLGAGQMTSTGSFDVFLARLAP